MSSKIEWTNETWNPVTGCTKVSEGCANCYAERMAKRLAGRYGYPKDNPFAVTLHPDKLNEPLKWKKPRMIFVCSMGDLFHKDVPFEFVDQVFAVMAICPQHAFQVLTKRSERMLEYFTSRDGLTGRHTASSVLARTIEAANKYHKPPPPFNGIHWPLPNVWLGVSVEDQWAANTRIYNLRKCPAAVKFISLEPLIEEVRLGYQALGITCPECHGEEIITDPNHPAHPNNTGDDPEHNWCTECSTDPAFIVDGIDWIIVGGESGPGARPMHPVWVKDIHYQCQKTGIPFFFKQWGAWLPDDFNYVSPTGCVPQRCWVHSNGDVLDYRGSLPTTQMIRVGKKKAGRILDGQTWDEMPDHRAAEVTEEAEVTK